MSGERPDSEIEFARLEYERQRWQQELDIRSRELEIKNSESRPSIWKSPIALSITAAAVTLLGNAILSAYNASTQSDIEKLKLQSDLIKKFTEPTDTKVRRDNLKFLADSGLIPDYETKIKGYLVANPGTAPQSGETKGLTKDGRFEFGDFNVRPLATQNIPERYRALGRSVAALSAGKYGATCTAFLISPDVAITANYCIDTLGANQSDLTLEFRECRPGKLYKVREIQNSALLSEASETAIGKQAAQGIGIVLLKLNEPEATCGRLELSREPPPKGAALALMYVDVAKQMGGGTLWSSDKDCVVSSVNRELITHQCDDHAGAGGGVLVSMATTKIVGVHLMRDGNAAYALRADLIKQ